jgi:ribonucleoside-diphosphate reductase alpha chain
MTPKHYGPVTPFAQELHALKYRNVGETFKESQVRMAHTLKDSENHYFALKDILLNQRFMGGGRTQAAIGSPRQVTPFNCFLSQDIEDSFDSIMDGAKRAGQTMRLGGGIGFDFSKLRPSGDRIVSLDSASSGPLSFMEIYNSICGTIAAAGHRRGAMMGVLRVDHPDIEDFIKVKQTAGKLEAFNISIGITDEFMYAVKDDNMFDLRFEGKPYKQVNARNLWEAIMRATWDWAEPGVLFIDTINRTNNLWYCEELAATNPCGEQPLPPNGACLLGSFNMTKYIKNDGGANYFDHNLFMMDIPDVVRAFDNIHDIAIFPLDEQKDESHAKRRMGLGMTGLANAIESLGHPYGTVGYMAKARELHKLFRDEVYLASVELAKEKGSFPLLIREKYLKGEFIQGLPKYLQALISEHGIRNSHLISYAPTGTISNCADNVSGGIEPLFAHSFDRVYKTEDGDKVETVEDYGLKFFGVRGTKAADVPPQWHVEVQALAQEYCDSAVSKTVNIDGSCGWEDFKKIYMTAWELGAKGCTTFNADGKRMALLTDNKDDDAPKACFIGADGQKECS